MKKSFIIFLLLSVLFLGACVPSLVQSESGSEQDVSETVHSDPDTDPETEFESESVDIHSKSESEENGTEEDSGTIQETTEENSEEILTSFSTEENAGCNTTEEGHFKSVTEGTTEKETESVAIETIPVTMEENISTETEENSTEIPNDSISGLYISEVMSSNTKYIPVDKKYYDWIEIYNGGEKSVNLSDYYISDNREQPDKYRMDNKELKPGQFYVIYCSGLNKQGHALFKVSSKGEEIVLSTVKNKTVVDSVVVPGDLKQNESYGRYNGGFVYMNNPSPGSANNSGYTSSLPAPEADIGTGLYDSSVTVVLSGSGKIYYTLNGEDPTDKSSVYVSPIKISKSTSLRAVCRSNGRTSAISSFTYLIGSKHSYPVVNITIDKNNLTGSKGVLVNTTGTEYEYQAYISMIDNGVELFSAPCGFKLHGNDSKKAAKQNFQIRFRSKYGLGTLDYPLFENREYTTFNSLILHGGSEDCLRSGFRDELCTSIVDGITNLYVLACRPVVLYLNGDYWGMYWIRERFDALYCANNLGVEKESINLLHTYGSVSDGNNKEYLTLEKYCKEHDLRVEEHYNYVMDRIDAYSLMDWYICRSYFADRDLANIRFFQSTSESSDKKWRWCFFDLDWSFYHDGDTSIEKTMPDNGHHVIIRSLLKNDEFKQTFVDRYIQLMNTALSDENILNKLSEFEEQFKPELEADRKRFGSSVSAWERRVGEIKAYIKDGKRQKEMLSNLKNLFGETLIESF